MYWSAPLEDIIISVTNILHSTLSHFSPGLVPHIYCIIIEIMWVGGWRIFSSSLFVSFNYLQDIEKYLILGTDQSSDDPRHYQIHQAGNEYISSYWELQFGLLQGRAPHSSAQFLVSCSLDSRNAEIRGGYSKLCLTPSSSDFIVPHSETVQWHAVTGPAGQTDDINKICRSCSGPAQPCLS